MKKHIFVLLVPLLFSMASCERKPLNRTFIDVRGQVLEIVTQKPIANALVAIYEEGGEFLGSSWTRLLDSTRTDANGFYRFNKPDLDNGSTFTLSAVAKKYYVFDAISNRTNFETGKVVTNCNLILEPYAWIKVHVKNVNPFDENDLILLDQLVSPWGGTHSYLGMRVDTTYNRQIGGNINQRVLWISKKNGISTRYFDSAFVVPAHDTISLPIHY
jgi:hypothetical protein